MKKWLLALALPLALCAFTSQEEAKALMDSDLEYYRLTFASQYGPIEWKGVFSDWSLDAEISKAKEAARSYPSITVKDYQRIVKNFFQSLGDYHVNVSFYSTESAYLPISFKAVGNRYFVTEVNPNLINDKNAKAIQTGDEVVLINGDPASRVIQAFLDLEYNGGYTLTDRALGVGQFPLRLGSLGHIVPKGSIHFSIKHKATGQLKTYALQWYYHPEKITNIIPPANAKGSRKFAVVPPASLNIASGVTRTMLAPFYPALQKAPYKMDNGIGARESFVPLLGKKLWESNRDQCAFHAYIFETDDKQKVGYVRIPHYNASIEESLQFKEIIRMFQAETTALVIDQVNNPGGAIFYMYSLLTYLTDKPLLVPQHRIALTQDEVVEAIDTLDALQNVKTEAQAKQFIGSDLSGYPVTMDLVKQLKADSQFQIDQWNAGKLFTDPTALFGVAAIPPNKVHYTKPILILINELDFSCGDFMPAIMQDNKRAKLFGVRTAGAGGFVLNTTHPNRFGVESFSYTGSLAERVDLNPIENLGVHPDITYEISQEDLEQKYALYKLNVLQALKALQ